jgi:exodeoxyribonuclease V alpha subunit
MRGGLERWKRGSESRGIRNAIAYALEGVCDAHVPVPGPEALERYAQSTDAGVARFIVTDGAITSDRLTSAGLRVWLSGHDPVTGEERGKTLVRPDSDLLLDGTLNHPKSFSIAALLHPELAIEFEALQDRVRDRIVLLWQQELNARRGHGGLIRESIARLEVVELVHRRSRALDPHAHRHLWLNIKVQGADGRWTNVDSRVAMKVHTLVNAEGELAARTDPEWVAALARHGYTLNGDGEIAELAGAVRPFSRRSAQIEANRSRLAAEWSAAHEGRMPSIEVLAQIDRRAWATSRPKKPASLDEESWEGAVREELAAIDLALMIPRTPVPIAVPSLDMLDIATLAASAVVDADDRSRGSSGRFSAIDLRAGAVRAMSRTGVVDTREAFDATIDEIVARAHRLVLRLSEVSDVPAHVKSLMAIETATLKIRLAGSLDGLATPGRSLTPTEMHRSAAATIDVSALDRSQVAAACAISGSAGLVAVTGPAGTGKTTMLRAASTALGHQRRRMLVVAPTRKAAMVAAREVGAEATSLHALLYDYGYRWSRAATGARAWTRLQPGEVDSATGAEYSGPSTYRLRRGARIVVDEAGMVDLHTANALAIVALETGAGVAMIGDPRQALPVGHAGAMASVIRHADAAVELDTVHRFNDPQYAALTLRLRDVGEKAEALVVAGELKSRGHVQRVDSVEAARQVMVQGYLDAAAHGRRAVLVCGTNSEADAINAQIQQHRLDGGDLDPTAMAWGSEEQRLFVGDVVETRRNDSRAGVTNRAQWVIARIRADTIDLASPTEAGEWCRVSRDYALDHVRLAYASTVHGVQGETVDTAIVGPDVDAAGLYVGLTRGRSHNRVVVIERTDQATVEALAATMVRGTTEVTIQDSIDAAAAELRRSARQRATGPDTPMPTSVGVGPSL